MAEYCIKLDAKTYKDHLQITEKVLDPLATVVRKRVAGVSKYEKYSLPKLKDCEIPDEIKTHALEKYKSLQQETRRMWGKDILLVRCVAHAAIELNMAMDKTTLQNVIKLNNKNITIAKAFKEKIEDLNDMSTLLIEDYFNYYLKVILKQPEYLQRVKDLSKEFVSDPEFIRETKSKGQFNHTLSVSVLLLLLDECGVDISKHSKQIGKSDAGIKQLREIRKRSKK